MATPPPLHTGVSAASPRKRALFGWVNNKGCTHALKLRHSFQVDARTRMELGIDLDVVDEHGVRQMLHSAAPWASMLYRLDADDDSRGSIEVNPEWFSFNKRLQLGRKGAWWEVPLDTKLGLTYSGKPHIEVGIGNLPLALTLGALLLVAGKPIGVKRKEVGGLALQFPMSSGGAKRSLQERVELDASLRRSPEGSGLQLSFQQINGVLRLRQE